MKGHFGLLVGMLVLSSCAQATGDPPSSSSVPPSPTTTLTGYELASDIAEVMADSGFGCGDAQPLGLVGIEPGESFLGCDSPISSDVRIEVHSTEKDRLWHLLGHCPPYVYGDRWLVRFRDSPDGEALEVLARYLGGKVNRDPDCANFDSWLDERDGTVSVDSVTVDELRAAVGE